jgi:hypothetical protein
MAKNLLIVALQPISDREIESAVEARKEQGDVNVHVVAPAVTAGRFEWLTGADDDARAEAEKVADRTAHAIPADVETEVGEPDPLLAVQDALALFPADEILVAGNPDEKMQAGLRELGVPVTNLDGRGHPEEGDETEAVDYARDVTQGRSAETPFVVVGTVAAVIFGLVAVISLIAFLASWLA